MRKTTSIIGMVLALATIIYSFLGRGGAGQFFELQWDIWIYRLIWLALFGLTLNDYLKESRDYK